MTVYEANPLSAQTSPSFGSEVRQLRKARLMTLKDVAKASGVSVSHLSAIERDAVSPSLNKIQRIAAALDVPVDWFFAKRPGAGPMERAYVVRSANRRRLNMLYEGAFDAHSGIDTLLSSSLGGDFYMGVTEYPPHTKSTPDLRYQHDGEQHGLVLDGELLLHIEDEVITLKKGDSYSFPGHRVHHVTNASDAPATFIWATSPVIISSHIEVRPNSENHQKKGERE